MPYKQKKPCSYPRCPRLVPAGQRYCDEHRRRVGRDYDYYSRSPERAAFYHSAAWRKNRDRYLRAHPLCELCLQAGRYVPASLVHHKVPLASAGADAAAAMDEDNLMSLCQACHSRLHAERGDRWHNVATRGNGVPPAASSSD